MHRIPFTIFLRSIEINLPMFVFMCVDASELARARMRVLALFKPINLCRALDACVCSRVCVCSCALWLPIRLYAVNTFANVKCNLQNAKAF